MSKSPVISFADIKTPTQGVVVIVAEDGPSYGPTTDALNTESGGAVVRAQKVRDFKGKKGSTLDLLVPSGLRIARLLIVGAGKFDDYTQQDWLALGGKIRGLLSGREGDAATVILERKKGTVTADQAADLALGMALRSYKFDKYKSKKASKKDDKKSENDKELKRLSIQTSSAAQARRAYASRRAIDSGVCTARDLVNEPANILNPVEFAKRIKALTSTGLSVDVLDDKALAREGMGSMLSVGLGSVQPCRLVVMRWQGAKAKTEKPVVFVGKGVTFDTGGISIKPSAGMGDMKGDMAGAACVTGLMQALAERKAKVNAVGIVGLVENMPSGSATRPGDVVTAMSGTTIEILNTDAEGRLVLADALTYAQKHFEPRFMVNLATLTGAILVALGKEHAGLFSNNDELSERLSDAGNETGEKVWRLPLGPKYDEMIDSKVADIKNIGGRWAGSITAAQFLQRFVDEKVAWAHLDIAGTGMDAPSSEINRSWGSGYGVRLLDRLVADHYEK